MIPAISAAYPPTYSTEKLSSKPLLMGSPHVTFPNLPESFQDGPQPQDAKQYWREVCEHACSLTVEFDVEEAPYMPLCHSLSVDEEWRITLDSDRLNHHGFPVRIYSITDLGTQQTRQHQHISYLWPPGTLPAAKSFLELYQSYIELNEGREKPLVKVHYQKRTGATVIFLLVRALAQNPRQSPSSILHLVERETGYTLNPQQLIFATLAAKALCHHEPRGVFLATYPQTRQLFLPSAAVWPPTSKSTFHEQAPLGRELAFFFKQRRQKQTEDAPMEGPCVVDGALRAPAAGQPATGTKRPALTSLRLVAQPFHPCSPSALPACVCHMEIPSSAADDLPAPSSHSNSSDRSCLRQIIAYAKGYFSKAKQA